MIYGIFLKVISFVFFRNIEKRNVLNKLSLFFSHMGRFFFSLLRLGHFAISRTFYRFFVIFLNTVNRDQNKHTTDSRAQILRHKTRHLENIPVK